MQYDPGFVRLCRVSLHPVSEVRNSVASRMQRVVSCLQASHETPNIEVSLKRINNKLKYDWHSLFIYLFYFNVIFIVIIIALFMFVYVAVLLSLPLFARLLCSCNFITYFAFLRVFEIMSKRASINCFYKQQHNCYVSHLLICLKP